MKRFRVATAALLFALLVAVPSWPQASTSAVRGTVRDQSGGVVAGASVSVLNTGTNITTRTTTNEVGVYMLPGIIPGSYRLTVEAPGMQKFEATLTVQVQQDAVVNPVLRVGQVATEVMVEDVTPVLTEDRPTLSHVLERARIEQLPLNGRSFSSLLVTVPGMEGWRAFGMRTGTHEFVLDGSPMANRMTMMSSLFNRPPGIDAIQEFKVETNNSSAKYTRPVTAVASTKSGTNQFHGAVFETHRSNFKLGPIVGKARARTDYWDRAPKLIRNEWGASGGGPVLLPKLYNGRDRTFWFFAYEGQRSNSPSTVGYTVPTEAMRNSDFRGLVDSQGRQYKIYDPWTTDSQTWARQQVSYNGQLNVIDPRRISPLAKYLFDITPLPTHPDINPLLDNNWWGPVDSIRRITRSPHAWITASVITTSSTRAIRRATTTHGGHWTAPVRPARR